MDASSSLSSSIASSLYRLTSQDSKTALNSVSRAALANAAVDKPQIAQSSAAISSLGQLLSNLATFQTTLLNFQAPQYFPTTAAISSDSSVATASSSGNASGSFSLTVAPIASSQSGDSSSYPDTNSTVLGTGTLTIQLGSYDAASNIFTPSSDAPTSIDIGSGTLNNIANSINAAKAGVSASIHKVADGYQLQLDSTGTGANSAFQIGGTIGALNFDPTASSNNGISLKQSAGDASYTVNDIAGTSSGNAGIAIAPYLTANFYRAGSTTLSTVPDLSSVQAATKNLVDAYNSLQAAVAKEDVNSDSVLHNLLAKQLPSDMALLVASSYDTGKFTTSSLSALGISAQPGNGDAQQLSLDSTALQQAYTADPSGTATLLSNATQAFNELGQKYIDTVQSASKSLGLSSYLARFAPPTPPTTISSGSNGSFLPATPAAPTTSSTSSKTTLQGLQDYAKSTLINSPFDLQAAIIASQTNIQSNGSPNISLRV
jgi:flagellar hook-associated protein 2